MIQSKERLPLLHPASIKRINDVSALTAQTILISGQRKIGKLQTAEWLANSIVGDSWKSQALYLDQNPSGNISIDEIHKIRSITQYVRTSSSDRRVVIINNAHSLTLDAQNSFLKLLEEPPEDVYMLLVTSKPDLLLPTILSRVMEVKLQPPSINQVIEHHDDFDPELVKKLYLMTNGSNELISEMLEDKDHAYNQTIKWAKTLLGQSAYERLIRVDELTKDKQKIDELLNGLLIVCTTLLKTFAEQGKSVKPILPKIDAVIAAKQGLSKNHNTKLTLTLLFLSL